MFRMVKMILNFLHLFSAYQTDFCTDILLFQEKLKERKTSKEDKKEKKCKGEHEEKDVAEKKELKV